MIMIRLKVYKEYNWLSTRKILRPEMVESAMKRKLNAFRTITNKNRAELNDLSDILTEIESS